MRAALLLPGNKIEVREFPKPVPLKDQVLIKVLYSGLNHRDVWLWKESTNLPENGVVLGSDCCGIVEAVGEDADPALINAEVVINPSLNWGQQLTVQADSFKILGYPDHGTFADYVVVSKKNIFDRPENLNSSESAAVPLAALTAYRALFSKARLRSEEKVLITGIGSGAALWALQFALSNKAKVFVTSSSEEKIKKAINLGAIGGFNYQDNSWVEQATKQAGGFDVIIDSAGGPGFAGLLELAVPGGRIAIFGRTAGNITDLSTRTLYWKQLTIFGSTMGTRDEFLSMLDFVEGRKLKPVIDHIFPLSHIQDAFARMEQGLQFGKILIDNSK